MSAPSKEEIAQLANLVEICCGSLTAARVTDLAAENDRLRKNLEIAEQGRDAWKADRERLVGENERLRAERAECITLLERIFEEHEKAPDYWDRPLEEIAGSAVAMLAKLRGQP